MSTLEGGTQLVLLQLGLLLVEVLKLRLDLHGLGLAQYLPYFQLLCLRFDEQNSHSSILFN